MQTYERKARKKNGKKKERKERKSRNDEEGRGQGHGRAGSPKGRSDQRAGDADDAGLCCADDSGQSVAQSCVGSGTPGYTAPEAFCQDMKLSQSADTWSIGIIYYEMLTGNFETKKYIMVPPEGMSREAVITNGFKQMCDLTKQNIANYKDAIEFIISCTRSNPKERKKTGEIKRSDYYKKVF